MRFLGLLFTLVAATACGDDGGPVPSVDAAWVDVGPGLDGGAADAGDVGGPDAARRRDAAPRFDAALDDGGAADGQTDDRGPPDAAPPDPLACNGHRALCDRRYDEVAVVTTHNAFANIARRYLAPNQRFDLADQLRDGVRGLMLDTYDQEGVAFLCHGDCSFGERPLIDGLRDVADFLDADPRAVVSIIFEAYITPEATEAAFTEAGLIDRLHAQVPGEPWPTLGEMIAADRRLVVFTDRPGGPAWHHDVWAHAVETPFSVQHVDDFDCSANRGTVGHRLLILNHFITDPVAFEHRAAEANAADVLGPRALACRDAFGQQPVFVTVDFYDRGAAFAVVDQLNGLPP